MAQKNIVVEKAFNRERGEWPLVLGGETYIARLTTNAMAKVESISNGRTWSDIVLGLVAGSVECCRLLLWAALYETPPAGPRAVDRRTHPELSLDRIGDLIDESGGLEAITEQIKAFVEANARPDDGTTDDAHPRPATDGGTGAASTPTPLRSV